MTNDPVQRPDTGVTDVTSVTFPSCSLTVSSMNAPLRFGRYLAPVVLLVLSVVAVPLPAVAAAEMVRTDAQVAAMSPAAQASLLEPLRRIANVVDALGKKGWQSSYSGVELDAARDRVELFTTSVGAGYAQLKAGRRAAPAVEWSKLRIMHAAYSRRALDATAARIMAGRHHSLLRAVSVPADGSGVDVDTANGPADPVIPAGLTVPVHVRKGPARVPKSWADYKWHDSAPFIGGDAITAAGAHLCTAGLPAVRRADLVPVMITAAHCFPSGANVYTEGGPTGNYYINQLGYWVGRVGTRITAWDAEPIIGRANVADESDTAGYKPLTSVAYSYYGDYVCHDGVRSFFLNHPTPCGIQVTNGDVWFPVGGYFARGVEGHDVSHGWGARNGDSGATVFAVQPNGQRQARGIVSAGGNDFTSDETRVDWTEAPDIFSAYNLELNPHYYG